MSRRSLFIDEEAEVGSVVMDTNAFLLQEPSPIQCETITECAVRKFERDDAIKFLHKYPGVMITLLDSVMANEKTIYR